MEPSLKHLVQHSSTELQSIRLHIVPANIRNHKEVKSARDPIVRIKGPSIDFLKFHGQRQAQQLV